MKQQDFDRLKDICEKEGYDVAIDSFGMATYTITKKDIWEGVGYAECVISAQDYHLKGKIYKIASIHDNREGIVLIDSFGVNRGHNTFDRIKHFKPSTESAYVDQLKKEAFERFGEIKEGDKFMFPSTGSGTAYLAANKEWDYIKSDDQFFYYNIEIYKNGKWATKLPKRIKVKCVHYKTDSTLSGKDAVTISFLSPPFKDINNTCDFLASQLEKYLNNEL